ncbi:unnamed protein product [Polarella glacialis]|uniref:PARP n=1 Tax=Polarella glacialis TaxID=89957 RepID=A0A813DJS5_POLGL|nr:unnamed protein product [Polarella glacialis]CAE8742729.1 unnamed protein product [Polarella glacialis]|mmetsp:Transcript_70977/g.114478  ORF Transcript_70977/g.114478 Transcript_70977/m.114478 type:complete len:212 (+) Transcript_70977:95-730(+)
MAFFMGGGSPAHMMMGSGFPVMGGGFPSGGGLVEIQTEDGSGLVVGRQHLQGIMEGRLVLVKIDGENVLMDKEKAIMLREGHEGRRSQSGGRESHLGGNTRKLYHQTSTETAARILQSKEMLRGSSGLAGGGIYFAETPEETQDKCHSRGCILEATVRLGRMKDAGSNGCSTTFTDLQREGYDSVRITGRTSGTEFVVCNKDQVMSIRRYC